VLNLWEDQDCSNMIPILDLFESHLTVSDLDRSIRFYEGVLGLPIAHIFLERRVAFFWVGAVGRAMVGLWEAGSGPQKITQHLAFKVEVNDVLASLNALRQSGIAPLDFDCKPTDEPVVLCWMPAVAIYFHDPDGNLLEFLAMLPQAPRPDLGIVKWSSFIAQCN
jgi:lactoylglutathione lyase